MFCDTHKLAGFFVVSTDEADNLKKKLCTDPWKNYVSDLIKSLGVLDVRSDVSKSKLAVIIIINPYINFMKLYITTEAVSSLFLLIDFR